MTAGLRALTLVLITVAIAALLLLRPPDPASAQATVMLATGTNNIGDVDVVTLPALPAGSNLIGEVQVEGASNSFAAQSATGQTSAFVPAAIVKDHSVQLVTTGAPTACTYRLQGSNDGGTTWFDLSASDITCTSSTVAFEGTKPTVRIRGNLTALSGGTSPTVTFHYAGR